MITLYIKEKKYCFDNTKQFYMFISTKEFGYEIKNLNSSKILFCMKNKFESSYYIINNNIQIIDFFKSSFPAYDIMRLYIKCFQFFSCEKCCSQISFMDNESNAEDTYINIMNNAVYKIMPYNNRNRIFYDFITKNKQRYINKRLFLF